MLDRLRFYIGYDSREPIAWHVFAHSILARSSIPVEIIPLVQSQLRAAGLYTRARGPTESTEFLMTRFLVPHLMGYEGYGIFADCDMLMRADPAELLPHIAQLEARQMCVAVCPHDYVPKTTLKMDGQMQTTYPRKNWSSFMIFAGAPCQVLTPDFFH